MSQEIETRRHPALRKALKRAMVDPDFRQRCLTQPMEALRQVGLENLDINVRFVEKGDAEYTIVLPEMSQDLSDEKLDMIAGGGVPPNTLCCEPPLTIDVSLKQ